MPALRLLLCALFALSGFCGLIYESVWSHYLRTYLGHAAHGQTVVLVIFVGGLALGAWLAARYTRRFREPLLAYAIAEIAIGVFALVFHPLFVAVSNVSLDTLLPAVCSDSGWCVTQWIIAALLIVVPATALGATFPWMVAGVLRRQPAAPGHTVGVLYFANSAGAVAGVLASAFVLIPAFGLPGTAVFAGAVNIAIGAIVVAIAQYLRAPVAEPVVEPVQPAPVVKPRGRKAARAASDAAVARADATPVSQPTAVASPALVRKLLWVAALTGVSSFVYEIVWVRMLALLLGASTHAFELMLAAFIAGLATGSAWIRTRIDRIRDHAAFLGHVQVWMGVAAIATLALYPWLFDLLASFLAALARNEPGYALYQAGSAAIALLVMLPATFLAGMTLPLITTRLLNAGAGEPAIGNVYAANTVGAIAGVILAVHVLLPISGIKGALLAGALVDLLLGVWLLRRPRGELVFSWPAFAGVAFGLGMFGVVAAGLQLDPRRIASGVFREGGAQLADASRVVFHADGKTATVTVVEADGRRTISTNGKPDASIALRGTSPTLDESTQVLLGALALAAHPQAKRAAAVGIGSGMTSTALLASPAIERVDTIEIERRMVDGAKAFGERNAAIFSDARSRFVYDDAKAWLARTGEAFDLIVSEPSNPWVSGVASLFSEETYARFARHLASGGVLVQWIQLYEIDGALLSSIFRALVTAFPHYTVYQVSPADVVVIASRERTPRVDSAAVFAHKDLAAMLRGVGVNNAADIDGRWRGDAFTVNAMMAAFDAPANSDYRPFVDLNAARARFVRANSATLFSAPLASTSMLETLGAAAPRSEASMRLASALSEAVEAQADVSLPPAHAAYADAVRATRELFRTCKAGTPPAVLLEGAIGTAMVINDHAQRAQAEAAWKSLRTGDCYRSLDPRVRRWVELFGAVAARDAAAMAELGTQALAGAPHEFARDYALRAAVVGEIAQGRPEIGAMLIEAHAPQGRAPWLVALREASAGRSIAVAR